ncbi:hypothetical protein Q4S19_18800, partial [Morganella morganii]
DNRNNIIRKSRSDEMDESQRMSREVIKIIRDETILVDAIFSVYKYIDITVIFITSLLILWLSSISSDRLLRIILFLLSLLLITPYIFMAAYVALILSVSLMFV